MSAMKENDKNYEGTTEEDNHESEKDIFKYNEDWLEDVNFSKQKKNYPSTLSRLIFGVGVWSRKFRRRMMEIPQIRYSHSFLGRWLGNEFLANQMRVEIRDMIGCYHNHSFSTNERRENEVNNHENDEKWHVFFFWCGKGMKVEE